MSSENCTTKYMSSFVKKKKGKKERKIYGMYKKGPDASHQTQRYSENRMGKGEGQGDFSFSLYTILYGFIFLNFLGWENFS